VHPFAQGRFCVSGCGGEWW